MLHYNKIFRTIVLMLFVAVCHLFCYGETTIYLFLPSVAHIMNGQIVINGTNSTDFQGPIKKTMSSPSGYPIQIFNACKKKVILNTEGKVLISYSADKYDIRNGNIIKDFWKSEIQVNALDGSIHYIKVAFKGFSDSQLKLLDEKAAEKLLKDKKYISLDDYSEEE